MSFRNTACLLLLALTLTAHARPDAPSPAQSCGRLLDKLTYHLDQRSHSSLYTQLLANKSFRRFLRVQPQPTPQNDDDYQRTILRYIFEYSTRFAESAPVRRMRDRSLARTLIARGHPIHGANARQQFERISHANVERILRDYPYQSEPDMEFFEKMLDGVTPLHVHNSQSVKSGIAVPLLSFDRVRGLGLGTTGLLSDTWFNQTFMATTDDVFFHVQFGAIQQNEDTRGYGNYQLVVDSDFADRYGVISPFVMYPSNLLAFAKVHAPEEYAILSAKLRALRPDAEDVTKVLDYLRWQKSEEAFVKENLDVWTRIRTKLAAFDFTRPDFQRLVRQVVLSRLQKINRESPERFARLRANATEFPVFNLIKERFAIPLGFPSGFELRLPVSVPSSALQDREIE